MTEQDKEIQELRRENDRLKKGLLEAETFIMKITKSSCMSCEFGERTERDKAVVCVEGVHIGMLTKMPEEFCCIMYKKERESNDQEILRPLRERIRPNAGRQHNPLSSAELQ